MPRKCPPGVVICLENNTLKTIIITLIVISIVYFIFNYFNKPIVENNDMNIDVDIKKSNTFVNSIPSLQDLSNRFVFNNSTQLRSNMDIPYVQMMERNGPGIPPKQKDDIYLNPYAPPRKPNPYYSDEREVIFPTMALSEKIPINATIGNPLIPVATNPHYRNTSYNQVGILVSNNLSGEPRILPLFGRPLYNNRQKWRYYTMTDKNVAIKLPIIVNGKRSTSEFGCDEVFSNDKVKVEGYNDEFNANIYDTNQPEYNPNY